MNFATFPDWSIPATPGALSLFEAFALADLEGQWLTLSAGTQRALLGVNLFGKQQVRVDADGLVSVRRSVCFGTMYEVGEYHLGEIKSAIELKKKIRPGS